MKITNQDDVTARPRVGVSACVLGELVRFDGGHKRSEFVQDALGSVVDFVSVCPEKEVGLGVPRPALRLLRAKDGGARLVETSRGIDHTESMQAWTQKRVTELLDDDLDGFILQAKSPSCGMERVKTYFENGMASDRKGVGLFASVLLHKHPLLVVEESGRLNDMRLRDNFCFHLFAMRRAKEMFRTEWSNGDVVQFHTNEKMALLARGRSAYTKLGHLVAHVSEYDRMEFAMQYLSLFHQGLKPLPTRGRLFDALQHLAGHFKEELVPSERAEFHEALQEFQAGRLPMSAVARVLRVLAARHQHPWVAEQSLLRPGPNSLGLYNSAF